MDDNINEEKIDEDIESYEVKPISMNLPELKKKTHPKKTIKDIEKEYNYLHPIESQDQQKSPVEYNNEPNEIDETIDTSQSQNTGMKLTPTELYFETSLNTESLGYFYKKIGKVYAFFGNKDGDPILMIGPQWPMYLFLTSWVFGVIITFLYLFWDVYTPSFKITGIVFLTLFELSYTYTFVINPGYPRNDNDRKNGEPREDFRFCTDCKFFVNVHKKVNHCYDCGICIEGYDHHCPWTSKCIGKRNKYSFYMFMGSIMLIFGYFIWSLTTAPTVD